MKLVPLTKELAIAHPHRTIILGNTLVKDTVCNDYVYVLGASAVADDSTQVRIVASLLSSSGESIEVFYRSIETVNSYYGGGLIVLP